MIPFALLSIGASNLAEIEHTAMSLLRPFTGAGELGLSGNRSLLSCSPLAGCGDDRSNLLLGVDIFASIVRLGCSGGTSRGTSGGTSATSGQVSPAPPAPEIPPREARSFL